MVTRLLAAFPFICILSALICPTSLNAQAIFWKKDYIRDSSGSTIAVATPEPEDDSDAPTTPSDLITTAITTTSVELSWNGPIDALGYVVYRGAIPVGAVTGEAFTDVGLVPNTEYSYRVVAFDAAHNYSAYSSVLIASSATLTNVALASNGGTASASSSFSSNYPPQGANNGDRKGESWGSGGAWNDATHESFPDWMEIEFNGTKTISEVDVFTLQDNFWSPSQPTSTMTFSTYGLIDFEVQYWNGSTWTAIPGATVTSNNLVWRKFKFSPLSTSKIRVVVTAAGDGYSRITEIEAYPAN